MILTLVDTGMNDGLEAVEHALGTRRLVAELGIIPAQADEETVVVHSGHSEYSDGNINFNQMCRFKVPVEDAATQLKVLLYDAVGYPERKSKVGMVLLNVGQLYGHANTRIKQLCAIRLDKGSQPKVSPPCLLSTISCCVSAPCAPCAACQPSGG